MDLRRDVAREIARIYCRLSPSGIEALSEILVPFKYSKGDVVLPEGETCRHMYFVERGMVRQYYYKGGRDVTEHFSYEGRIVICIESFLKQEPSRLIVEALENSRLYGIPYDALQELADKGFDPQFGARPLKRAIQNYLEDGLSELIVSGDVQPGDTVSVTHEDGKDELTMQKL